jgi:hypothetical protein
MNFGFFPRATRYVADRAVRWFFIVGLYAKSLAFSAAPVNLAPSAIWAWSCCQGRDRNGGKIRKRVLWFSFEAHNNAVSTFDDSVDITFAIVRVRLQGGPWYDG